MRTETARHAKAAALTAMMLALVGAQTAQGTKMPITVNTETCTTAFEQSRAAGSCEIHDVKGNQAGHTCAATFVCSSWRERRAIPYRSAHALTHCPEGDVSGDCPSGVSRFTRSQCAMAVRRSELGNTCTRVKITVSYRDNVPKCAMTAMCSAHGVERPASSGWETPQTVAKAKYCGDGRIVSGECAAARE